MLKNIIAAVRNEAGFERALNSKVDIIFDLNPDLLTCKEKIHTAHEKGKKLFIHIDIATGIGKDKSGILYVKKVGVDGIISTRLNIIKMAKEAGLFAIQRFFEVDSQAVDTTIEYVKASKADMIEVMPGVALKPIKKLSALIDIPIIAGGLIETKKELILAMQNGAAAVSTAKEELWNLSLT